ncbi:MAG: FtsX-like permease family protein [Alphaproteobacteria bacterium]|nr:FtsX-like permease family protein [Alphaproteobacteria bacterium]
MMLRRSELQLGRDPTRRLVAFLIGAMVYLAALTLAGAVAVGSTIDGWGEGLRGSITVQLPGSTAAGAAAASARVDAVLSTILETNGVASAQALPRQELLALLERWLGRGNIPEDLPIPALIDVTLEPGVAVNIEELQQRLVRVVPGARVSDNGVILERLVRLVRSVQAVAALVVVLVSVAAIAIIVFVTRAGLAMHVETIELLHLIGARDSYIARQFVRHILTIALAGSVVGLLLAAATVYAITRTAAGIDVPLLPHVPINDRRLAVLAALPLIAAAIAMITTRLTVVGSLRRIP